MDEVHGFLPVSALEASTTFDLVLLVVGSPCLVCRNFQIVVDFKRSSAYRRTTNLKMNDCFCIPGLLMISNIIVISSAPKQL
jgi:hypothetical protein